MKTKGKEFSATLSRLLPVLKRSTLAILSCVKVEAKEGLVTATATDIDAFAAATCPCEGDLAPVCVDAQQLHLLVRQADDEVICEVDGNRLVVVGNGKARLSIQPVDDFPQWPQDALGRNLGVNPADLAACIKGVAWASDPNPKITIDVWRESVWVKTSEQAIECCATEGKEFAYVKQAAIAVPAEFIFPARQASLLCDALLTGAEGVTLSGNWVGTDSKQFRVAIKLAEGKFIPIQYILQQKARPIGVFQICRLVDTLQTVKALGRGEPWMEVRIHLDPAVDATQLAHSRVTYTGTNNNFERSLPHDLVGEPCKFKVDCERAIRVFGHVQPGAMASLGDGMVIFKDGDYTYTLALLRDTE